MDFIRLNLNTNICVFSSLVALTIIKMILTRHVPDELKRSILWAYLAVLGFTALLGTFIIISQLSVNQLPRSEIDRDQLNRSTNHYQNQVKKSKEEIE